MNMSVFFFCKRETAYEVCISDWSSDVSSSDLMESVHHGRDRGDGMWITMALAGFGESIPARPDSAHADTHSGYSRTTLRNMGTKMPFGIGYASNSRVSGPTEPFRIHPSGACKSEEHTSELQSLMRISYA